MNSNPELRSAGVPVQRVARGGQFPPPGGQTVCYRHTQGCGFGSAWIRIHPQKMNADPQLWLNDTVPVFWYRTCILLGQTNLKPVLLPYRRTGTITIVTCTGTCLRIRTDGYLVTYTYRW